MKSFIIVESPTKSRTISQFLNEKYKVLSSFGHIRDLPKSKLGIDIENDFKPEYVIPTKARKIISELKKETAKANEIILATDEDREGEAISWHLKEVLKLKNPKRIVFHEITKKAIKEALKNPRLIDMKLVDAQQARRILDRLVGYKLSPLLWKKITRGLSAGRVQSVAVRLICEKEEEIEKFKPEEYWTIEALFAKIKDQNPKIQDNKNEFKAILIKKNNKLIPKLEIKTKKDADKILKDLKGAEYKVESTKKKEVKKNPLPPFTTSTLQQTAWQRFRWPTKLTMNIAQQLYEKGLTTYHRTDSLNISNLALNATRKFITQNFGEKYYQFRKYKTKTKIAQEAHEAIRPTYTENTPEKLSNKIEENQIKLYDLIWRRFIGSQMAQAIFDSTTIDIKAKNYIFRVTGQILKFEGFLKVYPIKFEETQLPDLEINEILKLVKLIPSQHFTQPPSRYNEASLIKTLEKYGIGRPSTYAPIISTIQERNYVQKNQKKYFQPTEIGILVNKFLINHFPEIVDVMFTAQIEEKLDKIAEGKEKLIPVIKNFYNPFSEKLEKKYKEISKKELVQETNKICPQCGSKLLIRLSRYGKFYSCSKFPECKYTESLEKNPLGIKCPRCQNGEIVEKRTKKRKIFYGCNQFPKCDFALWDKPVNEFCPQCQSILTQKGKITKCSNRNCDYKHKKVENKENLL